MKYKTSEQQRKYAREYRAMRRVRAMEAGRCPTCDIRDPVKGYADCEKCREIKAKSRNNHTKKYKEKCAKQGRCKECTRPLLEGGQVRCIVCREKLGQRLWS